MAPNGVFRTIQGEGALIGEPMVFVRLAGCSVGCSWCDTDYSVTRRATAQDIACEVAALSTRRGEWVWITGGEPTDHDLTALLVALRSVGVTRIALATSGHKLVDGWPWRKRADIDFLSVSPHDPSRWVQQMGDELKLAPGLNGFRLADFAARVDDPERCTAFGHKFVSPCAGLPDTVAECVEWVRQRPGWRMTVQGHKQWGLA